MLTCQFGRKKTMKDAPAFRAGKTKAIGRKYQNRGVRSQTQPNNEAIANPIRMRADGAQQIKHDRKLGIVAPAAKDTSHPGQRFRCRFVSANARSEVFLVPTSSRLELRGIKQSDEAFSFAREKLIELNAVFGLGKVALGAVDQEFNAQRILPMTLFQRLNPLREGGKEIVGIGDFDHVRAAMINKLLSARA